MRPHIGAKKLVAATAVLGVGAASVIMLTSGAAQASSKYGYSGFAHGTYAYVPIADSGPEVSSFFGCTRKVGMHDQNKAASATASGAALAHSVKTDTQSHNDSRGDGTTSTAEAVDVKLGSLLKLTGVQTYSRAVAKNGNFETTAGTRFASVQVGNVKLPALLQPRANTKLGVPGLGYVVLNRQVFSKNSEGATASSAAVLIHATVKNPFLKKGSTVAVLLTKAEVGGPAIGMLRGEAWNTRVRVGNLVKSDPTSLQRGCTGTEGKVVRVSAASVTLPGLAQVRGASTFRSGVMRPDLVAGWMKAESAGVNLGNGKVKIGAITAKAEASKKANGETKTSWNSEILELSVNGKAVPVPKGPNQKMGVPGLGTITFNAVKQQKGYVSVTAIVVWVKALNTTVEIGHAESGVFSN